MIGAPSQRAIGGSNVYAYANANAGISISASSAAPNFMIVIFSPPFRFNGLDYCDLTPALAFVSLPAAAPLEFQRPG